MAEPQRREEIRIRPLKLFLQSNRMQTPRSNTREIFLSRKLKLLKRREEMRIRPLKLQSNRMKTPRLNTLGNLFLFRKLKLFLPSEDEQRRKSERVNPLYKPTPVCSNSKMEEAWELHPFNANSSNCNSAKKSRGVTGWFFPPK